MRAASWLSTIDTELKNDRSFEDTAPEVHRHYWQEQLGQDDLPPSNDRPDSYRDFLRCAQYFFILALTAFF